METTRVRGWPILGFLGGAGVMALASILGTIAFSFVINWA